MIYTNEVKPRKLYVFLCDLCERQIQGFNSKFIIQNSKLPYPLYPCQIAFLVYKHFT